jgi:hypothetical protein
MTVVFSDPNRVTWFVCPGVLSRFCEEFVERGLVTFQRSGRKDVVLAKGVSPSAVSEPAEALAVFERCEERRWAPPGSHGMYSIERERLDSGRESSYRLTSPSMVRVVLPGAEKAVGLLSDEELATLVREAFGGLA